MGTTLRLASRVSALRVTLVMPIVCVLLAAGVALAPSPGGAALGSTGIRTAGKIAAARARTVKVAPVNLRVDPSGQRPPTSEPGFARVFTTEFTGPLDHARWGAYSGQPGGDPGGYWAPDHVVTEHGMLVLRSYKDSRHGNRWVSGGVSSAPGLTQTYGMYLIRFRVTKGAGIGHDILLWPAGPTWPPEVDLSESAGGKEQTATATLHWGTAAENYQRQVAVSANFTKWHTLSVRWLPGRIVYVLDGHVFAIMRKHVPHVPMALDIQTQAGTCGDKWQPCPNAGTPREVNLDVDWVAEFRWRG
jgi:beta-glucanase (GH16 family)